MQVILLFLGCFLDSISNFKYICLAIFVPIIKKLGFDPISGSACFL